MNNRKFAWKDIKRLEKYLWEKPILIQYQTDRFDYLYEEAQDLFTQWKYIKSIEILKDYFDKTFMHGIKWLLLIQKNYQELGNMEQVHIYKTAESFALSIIKKRNFHEIETSYQVLCWLIKKYKTNQELVLLDIFYRGVVLWKRITFVHEINNSITYRFLKIIISTRNKSYDSKDIENYKSILDNDFTAKPVLLITCGVKFKIVWDVFEWLRYQDQWKPNGEFHSLYHKAYDYICRDRKIPYSTRLYYYLQSLKYDSEKSWEYLPWIIGTFFYLKLFESSDNIKILASIFSTEQKDFFFSLYNLNTQGVTSEIIQKIFLIVSQREIFYEIKEEDLAHYIYNILATDSLSDTCSLLKEKGLQEVFSKYIIEVWAYYREERNREKRMRKKREKQIEKEKKTLNDREKLEKQQLELSQRIDKQLKKHQKINKRLYTKILYWVNIVMFLIFIWFVVFVFYKQ